MEPVPRPEWSSPIEVGVHARSFYSALPEQPTRDVLRAAAYRFEDGLAGIDPEGYDLVEAILRIAVKK